MKKHFSYVLLLALMLSIFSLGYAATVQIGTGTGTTFQFPIYGNYGYNYSQQIYTQGDINYAGDITKIRFWYSSGDISLSKDWVIYNLYGGLYLPDCPLEDEKSGGSETAGYKRNNA